VQLYKCVCVVTKYGSDSRTSNTISYLGADEEEVTFDYLARNAGKNKPSYKKIQLCYIE
jgi:hypothetical protein